MRRIENRPGARPRMSAGVERGSNSETRRPISLERADQIDFTFTPASQQRPRSLYRSREPDFEPAVSIITPFFNPGHRFEDTAASVLAQTLQCWEWIIVDDASTDAVSRTVLQDVVGTDARIRLLRHEQNRGAGAARNTAFAAARAEYILQLDADDQLEPTAAEKLLWYLHTHPNVSFANGATACFGAVEDLWTRGFEQADAFLNRNFVGGRGMVRRAAHAAAGGYDATLALALEDWDFWLRCAGAGLWGVTLDEVLDWQHQRAHNAAQWPDWDGGERQAEAVHRMRGRHASLVARGVPRLPRAWPMPYQPITLEPPCENRIETASPNLLLIVAWLSMGGTDSFNLDLIGRLRERGWTVTVVTTLPSADPWRWEYMRLTSDVFMLHRFLEPAAYPAFLRYLIRSRRFDAVMISHSELGYQLLPALRSWCPEPIYLDYLHILEPEWKSGGYPRMSSLFRNQLDVTVTSSDHLREWMVENGGSGDTLEVVRTAIDCERFRADPSARAELREKLGIASEECVIFFAGRFSDQKRPLTVLRVFDMLLRQGLQFRGLLAGDGELRPEMERYIAANGLSEHVHLLGPVASRAMPRVMAASDIFFLPSQREGIAISIYEAMATGLAVVATEVGGQRELVVAGTGLLLPFGDDEEAIDRFTTALAELIERPDERERMGSAARRHVESAVPASALGEQITRAIENARDRRARAPRETVPEELGDALAEQAVEFMRLNALCDELWRERNPARSGPAGPGEGPIPGSDERAVTSGWSWKATLARLGWRSATGNDGVPTERG